MSQSQDAPTTYRLSINLGGGQTIETTEEFPIDLDHDDVVAEIQERLGEPSRPHWLVIGGALCHSVGVQAVEIEEYGQ